MAGGRRGPGTSLTWIEDLETGVHVYDDVPDYEDVF
jgi:hypothetical protein